MSQVLDLLRSLRRGSSARKTGATQEPGQRVVVAVTTVQLALTFPIWVRRRKWTFTYVDDTTIRQRQSVDFRLPQPERFQFGRLAPAAGDEILVPLWISKKTPLNDLDIVDEDGRTLSMRNQRENGEVAALGFEVVLLGLAAQRGIEILEAHRKPLSTLIARILTEPPSAAEELLGQALAHGLPGRILADNDEYRALLTDLARGFMVLVPVTYEPGRSRVLKLSHQTPLFWTGREEEAQLLRWWHTALASIGWADKEQVFDERAIGWAEGTHFQIKAPEDVERSITRSERIRQFSCQPPTPPQPPTAHASASAQNAGGHRGLGRHRPRLAARRRVRADALGGSALPQSRGPRRAAAATVNWLPPTAVLHSTDVGPTARSAKLGDTA